MNNDLELIAEFLANLYDTGIARESIQEKGYTFALTLQTERLEQGAPITSECMMRAAALLSSAQTQAAHIYDVRHRMH